MTRVNGKVKWFNSERGFGFIEHPTGSDVFVHYSEILEEGYKRLEENDVVSYEAIQGSKGWFAKKVAKTKKK